MAAGDVAKVKVAPSPALTGTTLTVEDDEGARFPDTPFTALVWPGQEVPALGVNAEEPTVSSVDGDVFTLARGALKRAIEVGDRIAVRREKPSYQLHEDVVFSGVFSTSDPPYVIKFRDPQGGTVHRAAQNKGGGTAGTVYAPAISGHWYYRFEGLDSFLPEEDFFVEFSPAVD